VRLQPPAWVGLWLQDGFSAQCGDGGENSWQIRLATAGMRVL